MKKILSLLLAFLMATGLILSFGDEAYAEDDPFISPYEQYFEVEFDFTYDSWFQEIEFLPQRAGFYLIQVFGDPTDESDDYKYVSRLAVRLSDSDTYLATAGSQTGYGSGRLVWCNLPSYPVTLEVNFSLWCENARVSITYVDFDYYMVDEYEDIECYSTGEHWFTFTSENDDQAEAVLIMCPPGEAGEYSISVTTSNGTAAAVYFMDPTAESLYGGTVVYSGGSYILEEGIPYYMVVCLDLAYNDDPVVEVDSITVVVTFTKVR